MAPASRGPRGQPHPLRSEHLRQRRRGLTEGEAALTPSPEGSTGAGSPASSPQPPQLATTARPGHAPRAPRFLRSPRPWPRLSPRPRPQVEILDGRTECVLSNLRGGTRYTFMVRARMAEPSFGGFWSAWSEPASLLTASGEAPGRRRRGWGGTRGNPTALTDSLPPRLGPPHPDALPHPRAHPAAAGRARPALPPPVSALFGHLAQTPPHQLSPFAVES